VQFPTRTPQLYADKVAPLVEKAMKGFNSTVFAYGQTGSGKSHTMVSHASELRNANRLERLTLLTVRNAVRVRNHSVRD